MKNQFSSREENLREIRDTAQQSGRVAEKILSVLPIGVTMTDREGKFTYVNPRFCDIFGYSDNELIGKNLSMVATGEPEKKTEQVYQLIGNEKETQGEWEVQRKGGEKFNALINAASVEDEQHIEKRRLIFMVDLSNASYSSSNLRAALEMLSKKLDAQELAYYISNHDMRNNLANISQLSELLTDTELDKKQQKWVQLIQKLSKRTLKLLKMSSDYLKMENGKYEPEISRFDLLSLLQEQVDTIEQQLRNQEISTLTFLEGEQADFRKEQLQIEADHLYLERMFNNLLINAVEASPNKETIRVNVSTEKNLRVTIYNQGKIPEDVQAHFFDKFATSGKEDGTGLGTYIAKLVTELHGGSIDFKTSEEDGTYIIVDLPLSILNF